MGRMRFPRGKDRSRTAAHRTWSAGRAHFPGRQSQIHHSRVPLNFFSFGRLLGVKGRQDGAVLQCGPDSAVQHAMSFVSVNQLKWVNCVISPLVFIFCSLNKAEGAQSIHVTKPSARARSQRFPMGRAVSSPNGHAILRHSPARNSVHYNSQKISDDALLAQSRFLARGYLAANIPRGWLEFWILAATEFQNAGRHEQ